MRSNLFKRGFGGLVITQFFGAANDNLLKGVLSFGVAAAGFWAGRLGDGGQAYVFWCLTLPFIFLSGYAGQVADRFSKQKMTVAVKGAEVFIALVALVGFLTMNLWVCIGAMVLLATQSAFFGPAKYGMIPEVVEDHELSRANGAINMFTNIAIIAGTLLAGPVYEAWRDAANGGAGAGAGGIGLAAPGLTFVGVAVLGLGASLIIPRLRACDPDLRFDFNPFSTYVETLRDMAGKPILWVAFAWSFFYLIGAMALLILPDYPAILGVSETKVSMLMGLLGVTIGVGSVLAGLVSGHHIEPRLIPFGAIGMTVCFFALGVLPRSYWVVAVFIGLAGFSAGFYIIPLQALLQFLSPDDERGRFLGTANALSFVCSSIAAVIFLVARQVLGMDADRVFIICAVLALIGTGVLIFKMRRVIADPSLRRATGEDQQPDDSSGTHG